MKKRLRFGLFVLGLCVLLGSNGLTGQDPAKKDETKKEDKKNEPAGKYKGTLPQNWREIGLTDNQKQEVYRIQTKYNEKIDKLEAEIKELKTKMSDDRFKVLTAEQKKSLEAILKAKAGTKDK